MAQFAPSWLRGPSLRVTPLLVAAACLAAPEVLADVFVDTKASCMESCTGPCCEERCSYAACVAQVMSVDREGVGMTDPGAWGAALAVCETQAQRIRQCSDRLQRQREQERVGVTVLAETVPDPRRVGQRYTFTLAIENRSARAVRVTSVGAETSVDGVLRTASTNYFNPERHANGGWVTSVAPAGRSTVIFQGTGTATAESVGVWTTRLVFHTDVGDFELLTSSRVVP